MSDLLKILSDESKKFYKTLYGYIVIIIFFLIKYYYYYYKSRFYFQRISNYYIATQANYLD